MDLSPANQKCTENFNWPPNNCNLELLKCSYSANQKTVITFICPIIYCGMTNSTGDQEKKTQATKLLL